MTGTMISRPSIEEAVENLQQLGMKEYEAKCFVGLSRMSTGTAKDVSEVTDVPRTRVYDSIRVLEAQGLVEIQHSSPQRYRAVPVEEAVKTLRDRYEDRVQRISNALDEIAPADGDDEERAQEVWSISGRRAIDNRTAELLSGATDEVVLVVGDGSILTGHLERSLREADCEDVLAGSPDRDVQRRFEEGVPGVRAFASDLSWFRGPDGETTIGRLLLADRSNVLVSSVPPESGEERAVFGRGFSNALIVVARRLMDGGLVPSRDPGPA